MVRAIQVTKGGDNGDGTTGPRFVDVSDDELGEGDTLVEVLFSSLNFKDGLALAGNPGVVRVSPLIPGIDVVGRVIESADARFRPGTEVVLTGAGLGETRNGGYADRARLDGALAVVVPPQLGARRAAAIGTAGFTAAQAVLALEDRGIPDGPVAVTGASGGAGSIAVALLAAAGREVVAVTGSPDAHDWLRELGASDFVDRTELAEAGKPLQKERWAGAVDGIGGATLHNLLAQTRHGGAVAAFGLVQSAELHTSVHPFILRGVGLLGINSVEAGADERARVWERLARDLDPALIDRLTSEITLDEVVDAGARILAGGTRGRTVVAVNATTASPVDDVVDAEPTSAPESGADA
ncbi:MDR family oxidoreductase [Schumannella luteola]|uniref:Acrylyl-CoA reductase (NADPH) n=1 Tax=Schumannella luteola TaxID=472059 RepID=A0A852YDW8_9MICO|nr:MDR family oxidoreductase [Schumannella luteola]NYG97867.1 acrylyl-CoA reductase (NADPH) [Schumannella luteola]TPX04628.1 oxidoreductase [Schumannella luteola]